ncbi:hypothetical protein DH2020_022835 [Rehmannia glutinosa]|uniref:CCHC-type domain-containing protein n=1 Tax=Rehmannia glutinosa TaxID=99300 RepID=A0ABR0W4C6_REHGL
MMRRNGDLPLMVSPASSCLLQDQRAPRPVGVNMATEGNKSYLAEEEEEPIVITDLGEGDNRSSLCLIGKVATHKPFNAFGLLETMKKVWKPTHGIAKEIESNLFSFQFKHWRDVDKILSMEPWQYDKNILVLKRLDSGVQPSSLNFDFVPFWIRIYDLPIAGRQTTVLRAIGNRCGQFLEVDPKTLDRVDRSIRIKILLDTTKPLKRRTKIVVGNGQPIWVQIKYERLPSFCYICGCLGHIKRDCEVVEDREEINSLAESELPFGDELRASPMKHARVMVE